MHGKWFLLLVVGLFLALMGCGPSSAVTEEEATGGAPLPPEVTNTAVPEEGDPVPESYPAEEVVPDTAVPESYPPPTQPVLPAASYPAEEGTIWVARPVGVQCEAAEYADIHEASADLMAIGVDVLDEGTFEMNVLAVCGGPTSAHFRVLVAAEDVEDTAVLGWKPMEN